MNAFLKKLVDGAADAGSLARSIAESGIRSVSEVCHNIRIYGTLTASEAGDAETDETHYVLVPVLGAGRHYSVYTKRILPPGIGATNSLPKSRIFHVPDESGRPLLERELIANLLGERLDPAAGSSDFADTLEGLADRIDRESTKISGGLVLVGGVIAMANPLLGVGIAVNALWPSMGAMATKAGAEYVGKKLRGWNQSSAESKIRKGLAEEVRRLKPAIFPNPLLRSLDAIATNPDTDFDPVLDHRNWIDHFEPRHYHAVTEEAIREVYVEALDHIDARGYQEFHIRWIRSFLDDPNSK